MTLYARNEMILATQIVKSFKTNLDKVTNHAVEKLAIMRNNKPEAVLLSIDEYEKMHELFEYAERLNIFETIQKRKASGEFVTFEEVLKQADITQDDIRD